MSKRAVNLNGSSDSRLRPAALHFVNMPPERFDWSDHRPPQASPSPAGLAPAGLAEAAPPQGGASGGSAPPDLVVRSRREVHQLKAGTPYYIGRDPKSDIVMTDSRVSWRHGVLRVDGAGWIVEDLGSTNGTFLGLQRLDRIEIGADCVIRLGNPDDGPVLRCMPQVPAVAAGQAASPLAEHPGAPMSASPPAAPPVPEAAPEAAPPDDSESWWQPPPEAGPVSLLGGVSAPPLAPEPAPAPLAPEPAAAPLAPEPAAAPFGPRARCRPVCPARARRAARATRAPRARPAARRARPARRACRAGPAAECGPQAHGADAAAGQGHAHRPHARQ